MEGYRREVDIFVAGVDTGGTVTGIGEYLKSQNPNVKVVAVGPAGSPVLSKRTAGPHKIQGIKPNTIRLSIGTENVKDLIAALDEAFKSIE